MAVPGSSLELRCPACLIAIQHQLSVGSRHVGMPELVTCERCGTTAELVEGRLSVEAYIDRLMSTLTP